MVVIVGVASVVFVVRGLRRGAGRNAPAPASASAPTVMPLAAPSPPTAPPRSAPVGIAADDAEEREARAIEALVAKGDIGRARADTEEFFARHPTGPRAARLERLTGVHPHPEPPAE